MVKNREELLAETNHSSPIRNADTARKFLCEKGFTVPAGAQTIEALSAALLEFCNIAPGLTALHKDTLRAIAILLESECITRSTEKLIHSINESLKGPLGLLKEKVEELDAAVEKNKESTETITRAAGKVSTQLEKATEFLEGAVDLDVDSC